MLAVAGLVLAVLGLVVSALLTLRVRQLEDRIRVLSNPTEIDPLPLAYNDSFVANPLEGLRIALRIDQDHPLPVFANLLKEQLMEEDVGAVEVLTADGDDGDYDVLITGNVICNGYADIYYQANLNCHTRNREFLTLAEKPPHGDRPANLAIEILARMKDELQKTSERDERRNALRELRQI